MHLIRSLLLVVAVAVQTMAADVGLYDISDASHPKAIRDKLGQVTISSRSNDNKRFFLAIHAAPFFSLSCSQIGLVVGNKTIHFHSQGVDKAGRFTSMETTVDDPEAVTQIAKHFHTKIIKRRHPGHRMLVEFIPDKTEFASGESVTVKLRITNIGERDFAFMQGGRQRGPRDNQFAFSAELVGNRMVSDTGDPRNDGGLGLGAPLKPGQTEEINVDLTKWFNFQESGEYNLRGSYYMEFIDPSAKHPYTIWEDFACAEFKVRIKN